MDSTVPPVPVPPGQSPPLYTITPTDQAGTIIIVTAVCLITAVVSLLVRAYVTIQAGTVKLRWDDWAVTVALLLAVVQTSLVQREAATGLGRTLPDLTDSQTQHIERHQYADQIFYLLAVWASKFSATLFFWRLSPRLNDRNVTKGTMALVAITGVIVVLLVCFVCDVAQPWQYFTLRGVSCTAPYNRWIGVSVLDILSEVALAITAVKILWPLKMPLSNKLTAGFVFLQRLVVIAPILARLYFLSMVYHGNDPTLQAAYSTVCKETHLTFAIVATNIPCFRTFLTATATNYGAPADGAKSPYPFGLTTDAGEAGDSVALSNLDSTGRSESRAQELATQESRASRRIDFSPHNRNQSVAAVQSSTTQQYDVRSHRSDDSREFIIRKDIDYNIQHYNGGSRPHTQYDGESRPHTRNDSL